MTCSFDQAPAQYGSCSQVGPLILMKAWTIHPKVATAGRRPHTDESRFDQPLPKVERDLLLHVFTCQLTRARPSWNVFDSFWHITSCMAFVVVVSQA